VNYQLFFLRYLEIDGDADERTIRRAYARKLKQIDQEQDPEGFQSLREAYDAAMRWAQNRVAEIWPADEKEDQSAPILTPAPPATPEPGETTTPAAETSHPLALSRLSEPTEASSFTTYDPAVAAHQVFDEFVAKFSELYGSIEQVEHSLSAPLPDRLEGFASALGVRYIHIDLVNSCLETTLSDERLINIEALDLFEWRLVCWLVDGWQSGNEALIGVAATHFNWDTSRQHLHRFGQPGLTMDRALNELSAFKQQELYNRNFQVEIFKCLRTDKHPGKENLRRYLVKLGMLFPRFPVLLPMIVSTQNIERWNEWSNQMGSARQEDMYGQAVAMPMYSPPTPRQPEIRSSHKVIFIGMVLLTFWFINFLATSVAPPQSYTQSVPSSETLPPAAVLPSDAARAASEVLQRTRAVTAGWLSFIQQAVSTRVVVPAGTPKNTNVVFAVVLDSRGKVLSASIHQASAFPEYDKAVERAIFESSPLSAPPVPDLIQVPVRLKFST